MRIFKIIKISLRGYCSYNGAVQLEEIRVTQQRYYNVLCAMHNNNYRRRVNLFCSDREQLAGGDTRSLCGEISLRDTQIAVVERFLRFRAKTVLPGATSSDIPSGNACGILCSLRRAGKRDGIKEESSAIKEAGERFVLYFYVIN